MQEAATIISFDPETRRLRDMLRLGYLEPFTYNGHPFFYCGDRSGKHLVWKDDGEDGKTIVHELFLGASLFWQRSELNEDGLQLIDTQTIFRQHDRTFKIIHRKGNSVGAADTTDRYLEKLPAELQRAIMALQKIGNVEIFPKSFADRNRRKRAHEPKSGKVGDTYYIKW